MYYVINVSQNKHPRHIFRTAKDSITSFHHAVSVAKQLQVAFPKPAYEISVCREQARGEFLDWENSDV